MPLTLAPSPVSVPDQSMIYLTRGTWYAICPFMEGYP
jgi:hypothetical protein